MKIKLLILVIALILIIPIFYIALCIQFDLDIHNSTQVLNEIYIQFFILKKELKIQVYIALAYSLLPITFTLMYLIGSYKKISYGYAQFADFSMFKKMGLNVKEGFTFCLFKGKEIKTTDTRSILVIAAPGTGKTSGIVIPNMLSIKTSAIILDIKGEIEQLTSKYRKEVFKNEILIFNPFGNDNNFHFNPFDKKVIEDTLKERKEAAREEDIDENFDFNIKMEIIKQTANVLFKKGKDEEAHWVELAKSLFIFFALYDLEKNAESNLFRLMRYPKMSRDELLSEEVILQAQELEQTEEINLDDMKLFFNQVSQDENVNPLVRDMARANERTNEKEYKSIVTSYARKLDVFTDYRIKKVVESMNFKYEDFREKNITLYLKILTTDIDTLSPLIAIILETIGKALLRKENNDPNKRVDFILDEFVRFGKIPFILELPAISRSYNIPGTYIVQTSNQVIKYYSLDDLKIISGSCAYNIIFTISDIDFAKMLSESIGNITRDKKSITSQAKSFLGSTNKSDEGYALLTPQDLMNIPNDVVMLSVLGHKATPVKGKINYFFKNRKFKKIVKKYSNKEN